jgi:hypothetical protein
LVHAEARHADRSSQSRTTCRNSSGASIEGTWPHPATMASSAPRTPSAMTFACAGPHEVHLASAQAIPACYPQFLKEKPLSFVGIAGLAR